MSANDLNQQQLTFDRVQSSYLSAWCRFHPEAALDAGVEDYADQLQALDDETIGIQIVLNEKCMAALDGLDIEQLDDDRKLNYQVLYSQANIQHHNLLDHDWRHRDPTRFSPISALYQLTVRPLKDFDNALLHRLLAIPNHLREAKHFLNSTPAVIPTIWLEMAIAEIESGINYCQHLHLNPLVANSLVENDPLEQAISDAGHALENYLDSLKQLQTKSAGDFACGREHFERLLQQHHFLPISSQALHRFGQQLFEQTQQQLQAELQTSELTLDAIQQQHPSSEQLLTSYHEEMQAAEAFVRDKKLVTLPLQQSLNIVSTPPFLQHQIPFAAYLDPSIADMAQIGQYYVTPVTNQAALREHNFASISQTSIHEAWPGHHLQFVTANFSAQGKSLLRRLNPSATLYEGWALYCEQMMLEQGFKRHPGQKIILLRDRLWRALRIIIDVEIHTQGLSLEAAAQKMVDALGFSHQHAMTELSWYSQAPTTPMSYAVGWALINALRDLVDPVNQQELKVFHDKLLACGSIALSLVIQRQFGQAIWQECCQRVFGENYG